VRSWLSCTHLHHTPARTTAPPACLPALRGQAQQPATSAASPCASAAPLASPCLLYSSSSPATLPPFLSATRRSVDENSCSTPSTGLYHLRASRCQPLWRLRNPRFAGGSPRCLPPAPRLRHGAWQTTQRQHAAATAQRAGDHGKTRSRKARAALWLAYARHRHGRSEHFATRTENVLHTALPLRWHLRVRQTWRQRHSR